MRIFRICLGLILCACGARPPALDAGQEDSGTWIDGGSIVSDAGFPATDGGDDAGPVDAGVADAGMSGGDLSPCPTSGTGAIVAPAGCTVFTPVDTGASALGDNATENAYALEPAGTPRHTLLVFFNASRGKPAGHIPNPTYNFYNAAANSGLHVIALPYRSSQVIGIVCINDPPCFALARRTVIRGIAEPGVASTLANIRDDEGVVWRLDAALRTLVSQRPGQGWEQFVGTGTTPEARINWSNIMAAGHSQGGGHAAYMAKLFPLQRVIQLSSTCDAFGSTPAPWTSDGLWLTSPASNFVGLGTAGDTICPYHVAVWTAMGMDASRQFDNAELCGKDAHIGSSNCVDNYPRWLTLF